RRRWLGFRTCPGRSLVLQAENPERELQTRLRIMLQDTALPEGALYLATRRGVHLDQAAGLDLVRRLIESCEPDLLVVDPFSRYFSGDENSARDVGAFVAALDSVVEAYAVSIIVVHH